jgi:hypothetical protein
VNSKAEKLGGGHTFLIFTTMMVLQLLFVIRLMLKTKEKTGRRRSCEKRQRR